MVLNCFSIPHIQYVVTQGPMESIKDRSLLWILTRMSTSNLLMPSIFQNLQQFLRANRNHARDSMWEDNREKAMPAHCWGAQSGHQVPNRNADLKIIHWFVSACTHAIVCMCKLEDNLWKKFLFFYHTMKTKLRRSIRLATNAFAHRGISLSPLHNTVCNAQTHPLVYYNLTVRTHFL